MNQEISFLVYTAASIGLIHTLLGPDHYLPFIVMSKARNWSIPKTLWITFLCGIGHVGSSVLLGIIGIVMGIGVNRLENVESFRGNIAAWILMLFGFIYMIWGLKKTEQSLKNIFILSAIIGFIVYLLNFFTIYKLKSIIEFISSIRYIIETFIFAIITGLSGLIIYYILRFTGKYFKHVHVHSHNGGIIHNHEHIHSNDHNHTHNSNEIKNITPWILFVIFVLGPCEPLIPLLMFPAAKHNTSGLILVTVVFCLVTILTMLLLVLGLSYGLNIMSLGRYEKYTHYFAGGAIFLSGVAIIFLGL